MNNIEAGIVKTNLFPLSYGVIVFIGIWWPKSNLFRNWVDLGPVFRNHMDLRGLTSFGPENDGLASFVLENIDVT